MNIKDFYEDKKVTLIEPNKKNQKIKIASNKKFGYTFGLIFLAISVWPYIRYHADIKIWSLFISCLFLIITIFADNLLSPLNKFWFQIGNIMHVVASPIIMLILFYCVITPTAIILRLFNKDILRLRNQTSDTYWILRSPPGPSAGSTKHQY